MTNDPARGVHLRYPWRCRIFGHRWRTFDRNWCGTDHQICQRIGFFPLKICGAVRSVPTDDNAPDTNGTASTRACKASPNPIGTVSKAA